MSVFEISNVLPSLFQKRKHNNNDVLKVAFSD